MLIIPVVFFTTIINTPRALIEHDFAWQLLSMCLLASTISIATSMLIFPRYACLEVQDRFSYSLKKGREALKLAAKAIMSTHKAQAEVKTETSSCRVIQDDLTIDLRMRCFGVHAYLCLFQFTRMFLQGIFMFCVHLWVARFVFNFSSFFHIFSKVYLCEADTILRLMSENQEIMTTRAVLSGFEPVYLLRMLFRSHQPAFNANSPMELTNTSLGMFMVLMLSTVLWRCCLHRQISLGWYLFSGRL